MTTTVARQQSTDTPTQPQRDPLSMVKEEWQRFLANFEKNGNLFSVPAFLSANVPTLDIAETDKNLELRMDLPGMRPEEIDIRLSENTITISGERKTEAQEQGKTWHRSERHLGEFSRTVTLPCAVKNADVQAHYREGVLTVTLPKLSQAQTRKINVQK